MTLPPDWNKSLYAPPASRQTARPKKRVFLSFRAEDRQQVQGLRLLAANPDYDLEFYDESVRVAIDSHSAEYVKRVIRDKISRSSVTVCRIGALQTQARSREKELLRMLQEATEADAEQAGLQTPTHLPVEVIRAAIPADTLLVEYFRVRDNRFWYWDPAKLKELIEND